MQQKITHQKKVFLLLQSDNNNNYLENTYKPSKWVWVRHLPKLIQYHKFSTKNKKISLLSFWTKFEATERPYLRSDRFWVATGITSEFFLMVVDFVLRKVQGSKKKEVYSRMCILYESVWYFWGVDLPTKFVVGAAEKEIVRACTWTKNKMTKSDMRLLSQKNIKKFLTLGVSTILRRNLSKKEKILKILSIHTALVKEVFPQTNS